ncbi:MAG: acyl-CoA thioesterase [Bacteroidota bacterium]
MEEKVSAKETQAIAARMVMPNETNTLGNLMGGQLLLWMDINAAISAHRLCKRIVVTASVNNVSFNKAIKLGDIVTIESWVTRSFSSSMEVFSKVWVEHHQTGKKIPCNESYYTFVAVDQLGSPIRVPELVPETETEKERHAGALRRKQLSLILAGRMNPEDATELKNLFIPQKK